MIKRACLVSVLVLGLPMALAAWPDEPESPAELEKLLGDPKPDVRLRAALALVERQHEPAVQVLVDLLTELPAGQRRPAEEALQRLAGEWAPNPTLSGEDEVSGRIRRDTWAVWWRHTDGAALLAAFRKRSLTDDECDAVRALIVKMGDKNFAVRQQATADLVAIGPKVKALLNEAKPSAEDLEQIRRIEGCLKQIAKSEDKHQLPRAAAGLLTLRKPAGAVEALLAYLPFTDDEVMKWEIGKSLKTLGVSEGKPHPALVKALDDPWPVRRLAAAELVIAAGTAEHRGAVRKLLNDPNPDVRLRVAVALARARDKEAVPALIDLAVDKAKERSSPAQDILRRLSSGKGPDAEPGTEQTTRDKYRDAWRAWWKENAGKVDLAQLAAAVVRKARVTARASSSAPGQTPEKAFDGDNSTIWNAGDYAPHWLEADLGTLSQLASIVLQVSQLPAGETVHEIWVSHDPIGADRNKAKLVHTFSGNTDSGQKLRFDFPKDLFARYVQIHTTQSPSWVSWVDVEILVR